MSDTAPVSLHDSERGVEKTVHTHSGRARVCAMAHTHSGGVGVCAMVVTVVVVVVVVAAVNTEVYRDPHSHLVSSQSAAM